MTAIQSRPQHLRWANNPNRAHAQVAKPTGTPAQTPTANLFTLSDLPRDTVSLPRFSGQLFHRVADDSAIIKDAMHLPYSDPPLEFHDKIDPQKLEIAHELNDWMSQTLNKKNAIAAVVARNGNEQAQRHDATGMAHSGLALYDPDKKQWMIYNLLNDVPGTSAPARLLDYMSGMQDMNLLQASGYLMQTATHTNPCKMAKASWDFVSSFSPNQAMSTIREVTRKANPRAQVWRSEPLEFFYEQPVNKRDALIMIPSEDIQNRLRDGILNGRYKKLYFTPNYNLVSAPNSETSLNCNKWVLMNILAAKREDYTHTTILKAIEQCFKPGRIHMNPLLRPFAKIHPTILGQEVPVYGPINTITVESLYRSDLFPEKEFFIPRELKK